jgi:Fic family protein
MFQKSQSHELLQKGLFVDLPRKKVFLQFFATYDRAKLDKQTYHNPIKIAAVHIQFNFIH